MKKRLSLFMALCLGRQQQEFSTKEIIIFYTAFVLIMSVLSYFQAGVYK